MTKKRTNEEALSILVSKFGNNLDYSQFKYTSNAGKVKLGCNLDSSHPWFLKTFADLCSSTYGCPMCGAAARSASNSKTYKAIADTRHKEVLERCLKKNKDTVDYSKFKYRGMNAYHTFGCRVDKSHGWYSQTVSNHLGQIGSGCPKCKGAEISRRKSTPEEVVKKACEDKHAAYTDYSLVDSFSLHPSNAQVFRCTRVASHGTYTQVVKNHLNSKDGGCSKCSRIKIANAVKIEPRSTSDIKDEIVRIHGNRIGLSKFKYVRRVDKAIFRCNVDSSHGWFNKTVDEVLRGYGCPKCLSTVSGPQQVIKDILDKHGIPCVVNDRSTVVNPDTGRFLELDIFSASLQLAVEVNGVHFHAGGDRLRHSTKTRLCNALGISLLQLWDYEVRTKPDLIESMILHRAGETPNRVMARKFDVAVLDNKTARTFIEENHLYGCKGFSSGLYIGLQTRKSKRLGAVMAIGRATQGNAHWELKRFCTHRNLIIAGGASKLFAFFSKKYLADDESVVTYADLRYSVGNVYTAMGFHLDGNIPPRYTWVSNNGKLLSRRQCQKKELEKWLPNFSWDDSEVINMERAGYRQLWDCGYLRFIFTKKGI